MDGRPLVSVLVVTFNHVDEIGSCLDAATAQRSAAHDLEVIVVDNASTDGTVELLRSRDDIVLVERSTNVGFAGGVNDAFARARGEVVVLLNPDCVMDPGCIEAMWRHLAANPGVAFAAANLRYPDGRPQLFARREVTLSTIAWCFTEVGRRIDRRRGEPALAHRRYAAEMSEPITAPLEVDCPAAACLATWRRLLEPRPMDPDLPIVFNDAELHRRLRHDAYRAEVIPDATAEHAYGTSLQRVARARMRAEFVASMRRYVRSEWSRTRRFALWSLLVLDAATSIVLGITGPDRGAARTNARATLGGLGLPGGAQPWLAPIGSPSTRLRGLLGAVRPHPRRFLRTASRRARRRWFIVRLHIAAWLAHSRVDLRVHRTADLPRHVVFEVRPRCRPRVDIGRDVHIQPGLTLRLMGTLEMGQASQLRYGANLNVKGRLQLVARNVAGRGATIHADGDMTWGWGAMVGEYVSVIDSDHGNDGTALHTFDHPVHVADIRLGAASFIAAQSVVLAGTTVGDCAVVGANSVVTRDIPAGVLAVGTPATPLRTLPSWWLDPSN